MVLGRTWLKKDERNGTISFLSNNSNNKKLDVLTCALALCHIPCPTCTLSHYFLYQDYVVNTVITPNIQLRTRKHRQSKQSP